MRYLIEIDDFLCRILRGENAAWPAAFDSEFEQSFLPRSLHHGIHALVFERVHNSPDWNGWPDWVKQELTRMLRMEAAFDLLRAHEVAAFLEQLRSRGIPFLLTKGAALARTHYANSALRARCDTDLFIDIKTIERVRTALLESGYEVIPPIYKSHQFVGVSRKYTEASVVFDIHWRILNAPQFARVINFPGALDRSVPVPGMGSCRTLGAVDSLLMACMHRSGNASHDADRLIWLYDIHLLVSALTPAQLIEFTCRAVDKNVQAAACRDGLCKVQACFQTEIPATTLQQLATAQTNRVMFRRFQESNLALLIDDWNQLSTFAARRAMLRELFLPSGESLLRKYRKQNRSWLPLLYIRQIFGGLAQRLTLR